MLYNFAYINIVIIEKYSSLNARKYDTKSQ